MSLSFFARRAVVCWSLAAASPAVVSAQPSFSPQGGEYSIAGSMRGDQVCPSAAINANGGCFVWQDNAPTTNGLRICAERLNSSLTSANGSNFVVSAVAKSKTIGDQEKPQVALLQDGGAVIVWQCGQGAKGNRNLSHQVFARFLDANGSFSTKDLRVSASTKNNQIDPQVATLANGNVVVVWSSYGQDGDMQGVFARIFSPAGRPLGAEFQVNQTTPNNQRNPTVAALANGNFVVAWISELQRGPADVFARIFDPAGAGVTNEFPVNDSTNTLCANPSVAGSAQGGFAVAWSQKDGVVRARPSTTQDPTGISDPSSAQVATSGIAGSDGTVVTNIFTNSVTGIPSTLVSWVSSTNSWDAFARLFDAGGAAGAASFHLNSYTYGDQFSPRISALGANYMAVWVSLDQPDPISNVVDPREGVFGQYITGSGSLVLTNDLHVNTTTFGRQIQPVVVSDGVSRFLTVWSSFVNDPNSAGYLTFDLFARQYQQTAGQ